MDSNIYSDIFYFVQYSHPNNMHIDRQKGAFRHYINYVLRGNARLVSGDSVLELKPGDLYYIPMGFSYQCDWKGNDVLVHSLGFRVFPESESVHYALQHLPDRFVREVLDIPLQIRPDSETLSKFFDLLSRIAPCLEKEELQSQPQVIQKMKAYLYKHPRTRTPELARHCGVSAATLYALCKKQEGKTVNEVRQDILLQKAILLLKSSDMTIQVISDELGFSSPGYFRKVLRKHTGKTPRQIRMEQSEDLYHSTTDR